MAEGLKRCEESILTPKTFNRVLGRCECKPDLFPKHWNRFSSPIASPLTARKKLQLRKGLLSWKPAKGFLPNFPSGFPGKDAVPSPFDKIRSGRRERAMQLGINPTSDESFEANQSFPQLRKNVGSHYDEKYFETPNLKGCGLDKFKGDALNSFSFSPGHVKGAFVKSPDSSSRSISFTDSWAFYNLVNSGQMNSGFPSSVQNPNKAVVTINAKTSEILVANDLACHLFGYSSDEMCSKRLCDLFKHKRNQEAIVETHLESSGEVVLVSGKVVDVVDSSGDVIPVSLWMKKLDTESEPRCLAVMEPVERTTASVTFDGNGTILSCDKNLAMLHGYLSPSDIEGGSIQALIPSLILPKSHHEGQLPKHIRKQRATGRTKDGASFPLSILIQTAEENELNVGGSQIKGVTTTDYLLKKLVIDRDHSGLDASSILCEPPSSEHSSMDNRSNSCTYSDCGDSVYDAGCSNQEEPNTNIYHGIIWVFANISGMITISPNGKIHSCNHYFSLMLFGYTQSQLVGKNISLLIPTFCEDILFLDGTVLICPDDTESSKSEENAKKAVNKKEQGDHPRLETASTTDIKDISERVSKINLEKPTKDNLVQNIIGNEEEENTKNERLRTPFTCTDNLSNFSAKCIDGSNFDTRTDENAVKPKNKMNLDFIESSLEVTLNNDFIETKQTGTKDKIISSTIDYSALQDLPKDITRSYHAVTLEETSDINGNLTNNNVDNFDYTQQQLTSFGASVIPTISLPNSEKTNSSNFLNNISAASPMRRSKLHRRTAQDAPDSVHNTNKCIRTTPRNPVALSSSTTVDQPTSTPHSKNSTPMHFETRELIKNTSNFFQRIKSKMKWLEGKWKNQSVPSSPSFIRSLSLHQIAPVNNQHHNRYKRSLSSHCLGRNPALLLKPEKKSAYSSFTTVNDEDSISGSYSSNTITNTSKSCSECHLEDNSVRVKEIKANSNVESCKTPVKPNDMNESESECTYEIDIEDGTFFGLGRHRDGSDLAIMYQIKQVRLEDGQLLYCLWVCRNPEEPAEGAVAFGNLTLASSVNSTLDASASALSLGQMISEKAQHSEVSLHSLVDTTEQELTAGPYSEHYTTLQQIGKGAFGFVKMAYRNHDELLVITKFIRKAKVYDECWVEDNILKMTVPLEVSLLTTLKHPNIVQVFDVFENDDYFQMIMEKHGSGMDLFEFIDRSPCMDEPLASYIFRQVVSAVAYLHSLRILHRDIKDENIILNEKFQVKLIDFGSATFMAPNKLFSTFCGTVEYCSPEVLQGNKYHGPELEMWSLGVTLYTLIFGENPFFDVDETIKAVLRPPYQASKDLMALIGGLLNPDPVKRFTLRDLEVNLWLHQSVNIENYNFEEIVDCSASEAHPPQYFNELENQMSLCDPYYLHESTSYDNLNGEMADLQNDQLAETEEELLDELEENDSL